MKVFFTRDLHFGHANAIKFDNRPFTSVEEMDEELIRRWNNKVASGDLVYVLGDIIWKPQTEEAVEILKRLNGQKILIKGNHDRCIKNPKVRKCFANITPYDEIDVTLNDGTTRRCVLSHYYTPFYNGHRYGAIHLHGHSHSSLESSYEKELTRKIINDWGLSPQIYNVGCMWWNYEPVTLDEILSK